MTVASSEPDVQRIVRDTWTAVVWAEALSLSGVFLVGLAFLKSLAESCSGFECEDASISAGALVLATPGLVALFGASLMAARRSGWGPTCAVLQATVAFPAFWAVLVLGEQHFAELVDGYGPPLVLALGVQGLIAIRPTSPRAFAAGAVAVGVAVALAVALAESLGGTFTLALLVLPAIGLAQTLYVPLAASSRTAR